MKLEVGKYYKTRYGRKVGPMCDDWRYNREFNWRVLGGNYAGRLWGLDGESYSGGFGADHALIAEWTDEPTIGTLAEIGAKVGDVVKWMEDDGTNGDIMPVTGGPSYFEPHFRNHMELDHKYAVPISDPSYRFRIISRAPTGPVITETVTRKRIVPGVYGKVDIGGEIAGSVSVRIGQSWFSGKGGEDLGHNLLNRADLIAAIATLQQIADALDA